jgi:hypothetical protein
MSRSITLTPKAIDQESQAEMTQRFKDDVLSDGRGAALLSPERLRLNVMFLCFHLLQPHFPMYRVSIRQKVLKASREKYNGA